MPLKPFGRSLVAALFFTGLGMSVHADDAATNAERAAQVRAAETAFAKSMADRDFAAFGRFVADDAVFLNSGNPLRGKAAVLAHWQRFFVDAAAPFAWTPELVEVTLTGELGSTTGPVTDADGKIFARFYSTWRKDASGMWQIVFDNGYKATQ